MIARLSIEDPQHVDWARLYRRALAAGCGRLVTPAEERVAATDELLARALTALVHLGELAAYASVPVLAPECRGPLARQAAGVLRLLESALAAHGRDHGYRVGAWRQQALTNAWAIADVLAGADDHAWPLPGELELTAVRIGRALVALPRDRLAVPEHLSEAIGPLLVVYAAATEVPP